MSIADEGVINLNSKLEYNRCLIPDISVLESPAEADEEHKLDEKLIKLKGKGQSL